MQVVTAPRSIRPRVIDSSNLRAAARISLCTSRLLSGPASAVSMKGRSSSTRKCPTEAARQPKTSGFHVSFTDRSLAQQRGYSAARIQALQRSIALAQRSDASATLPCWSSRIALAFLAIESASVQIANHASALTASTVVLLRVCCKNSASPALRAMSVNSSAVGVVLRDRGRRHRKTLDRLWLPCRIIGRCLRGKTIGSPAGPDGDKYWCPVNRIDNTYGDRHLICSCPLPTGFSDDAVK